MRRARGHLRREGQKVIWTHSINDHRPYHEANQSCSSAKWVPSEVLEEGYGHIFGLQGLGRTPLTHLSTVSHVAKRAYLRPRGASRQPVSRSRAAMRMLWDLDNEYSCPSDAIAT